MRRMNRKTQAVRAQRPDSALVTDAYSSPLRVQRGAAQRER